MSRYTEFGSDWSYSNFAPLASKRDRDNFDLSSRPAKIPTLVNRTAQNYPPVRAPDIDMEDSYLHRDKHGRFLNYHHEDRNKRDSTSLKMSIASNSNANASSHQDSSSKGHLSRSNSKSNEVGERLERLEMLLEKFVKKETGQNKRNDNTDDMHMYVAEERIRDGLITFDPAKRFFTTSMWLNKIQDLAVLRDLNNDEMVAFLEDNMTGIIKEWYRSLGKRRFIWTDLKSQIIQTFPDNYDFVTTLKTLVTRYKLNNESITNYYYSKAYLLEACKISGEEAVSCIIDGLNNAELQLRAKSLSFRTPEILFSQFMVNLPPYDVDYQPTFEHEGHGSLDGGPRSTRDADHSIISPKLDSNRFIRNTCTGRRNSKSKSPMPRKSPGQNDQVKFEPPPNRQVRNRAKAALFRNLMAQQRVAARRKQLRVNESTRSARVPAGETVYRTNSKPVANASRLGLVSARARPVYRR